MSKYRNTGCLLSPAAAPHTDNEPGPASRPSSGLKALTTWLQKYAFVSTHIWPIGHLEMKYKTAELCLYANDRRPTSYCWRKYVLRDPLMGFVPNFVLRLFSSSPQLCSNAPKLSEAKRDIAVSCLYKCTDTCLMYCNSDSIFTSFILKVFG